MSTPIRFIWTVVFAIGAAGYAAKPNVVIFYTDDQGTLDAGCYGPKDLHTPAIDRIAAVLILQSFLDHRAGGQSQ